MTAEQAVAQYYDPWRTRRGDRSGVPLAHAEALRRVMATEAA